MLVAVSAGRISLETAGRNAKRGSEARRIPMAATAGPVKLVNTGKFVFHGVDIRLK
jgi:hypothetical protein